MKCSFVPAIAVLATMSLLFARPVQGQDKLLTKLNHLKTQEVAVGGFELSSKQKVSIKAVGFRDRSERYDALLSSAWILNADTREVVWSLEDANSERRSRDLRDYTDDPELDAGRYEVYYATFPFSGWNWDSNRWWDFSDGYSGDFDWDDYKDACHDFEIVVSGDGKSLGEKDVKRYQDGLRDGAVISRTALGREVYEKIGLELDHDIELEIYAIGEIRKDELYDGAWIVNLANREKVWELDYWDSDHAGGATKNRMFKGKIKLKKGKYAVFVATDDSHHFGAWNSAPPYDPYFWGVTIQVAQGDRKAARTFEYKDETDENVIVSLTRLRDGEFVSKGFTLKKDMPVRVYAIGEGRGHDMYDSSRIVDARTHKVVWEMNIRHTDHAGGATKNREFNDVVDLPAGNYLAYAYTDDSHAYHDWNASPPHDQEHWGLTILATSKDDMKNVAEYTDEKDKNTLVRLVGLGNNERDRERFKLDKDTKVSIYAIGEGTGGKMYDYAWIENAKTGRVVWEMTYRKTEHAGGAKKNREFADTIMLEKGEYIVYYESDGSHSFNHWNAQPPRDLVNWGVTVKIAEAKR